MRTNPFSHAVIFSNVGLHMLRTFQSTSASCSGFQRGFADELAPGSHGPSLGWN